MIASVQVQGPSGTVVTEGHLAYLGYRAYGVATLRLPSGAYLHERQPCADRMLAAAVLGDRLRREPAPALLERFRREWVSRNPGGEFVWPLTAVDEWLADAMTAVSPARPARRHDPRARIRTFGGRLLAALSPRSGPTPSPHGGC